LPVLYDLVISHPLEWLSVTIQLPPLESLAAARSHEIVLGTHTDDSPNNLMLVVVALPLPVLDAQ
jgi:histone-binding protein RBBP4